MAPCTGREELFSRRSRIAAAPPVYHEEGRTKTRMPDLPRLMRGQLEGGADQRGCCRARPRTSSQSSDMFVKAMASCCPSAARRGNAALGVHGFGQEEEWNKPIEDGDPRASEMKTT